MKTHEGDVRLMRAFYRALKPFCGVRRDMILPYVQTFTLVAMEPGLCSAEYAQRADVSQTVMTRYLIDISDRMSLMGPGCGLIMRTEEDGQKKYSLTKKGEELADEMLRALRDTLT
jgi:hypothetical protein